MVGLAIGLYKLHYWQVTDWPACLLRKSCSALSPHTVSVAGALSIPAAAVQTLHSFVSSFFFLQAVEEIIAMDKTIAVTIEHTFFMIVDLLVNELINYLSVPSFKETMPGVALIYP